MLCAYLLLSFFDLMGAGLSSPDSVSVNVASLARMSVTPRSQSEARQASVSGGSSFGERVSSCE